MTKESLPRQSFAEVSATVTRALEEGLTPELRAWLPEGAAEIFALEYYDILGHGPRILLREDEPHTPCMSTEEFYKLIRNPGRPLLSPSPDFPKKLDS